MSKEVKKSDNLNEHKSWKKMKQERKLLKKQRKQEKLLKELDKKKQLEEISNELMITSETRKESNPKIDSESSKDNKELSTISIAVPGSILDNAQSAELRTYLAGQIARAACIFRVDEIIIFDDLSVPSKPVRPPTIDENKNNSSDIEATTATATTPSYKLPHSCIQLGRILQYLECPQYLRKFFFPLHNDLKYSGLLNPLDAPHHLRQQNTFMYREGVVSEKKVKDGKGSYVNIGLFNDIKVDKALVPGLRVTVRIDDFEEQQKKQKKLKGYVVSPDEPRLKTGIYWGYTVRLAHSLSDVFTKCSHKDGYDLTIGTSDKGKSIQEIPNRTLNYKHALIVFGGLKGLELALENDKYLSKFKDPQLLFDNYINVVPSQGSRTIRTEEAILITLSILQEKLTPQHSDIEFDYKNLIPQSDDTGKKQLQQINAKIQLNSDDLSRFD